MSRNRPQGTKSPERLVLHRVLINSKRFYIHTNLIKFVIAHFKLENRSMSCTFQLICIASLLAFSTFILVFMQNCRDCRFSNSEITPMLPLNTRYDNTIIRIIQQRSSLFFQNNVNNMSMLIIVVRTPLLLLLLLLLLIIRIIP